jgi:type IV secretory pathway VirB10-like protein
MTMSLNDNNGNGGASPHQLREPPETPWSEVPRPDAQTTASRVEEGDVIAPAARFATRADAKATEGIGKSKLILLAGGLAIAVLFFVFTAVVGKSPKKPIAAKQSSQQTEQQGMKQPKGSVTPVMETVRTPAPDNASGQLGPGDIRRTRSSDGATTREGNPESALKPGGSKLAAIGSLGNVPSFPDTQQKWEEPQPYGEVSPPASTPQSQQQNTLKEASLVFVRSQVTTQAATTSKANAVGDVAPLLEMTPGTRIQAKLETQISSAVQAPVVAVVEYTYAIGDKVIVPAGARVYGQLQQADRSGLVSVKFDEIELLDGAREKIDAIGTGLDLGPIKGNVFGKNTGKNFLVRAASGLGSVLAEIAGNNSNAAFSEDDMLRERVAENIGTAGDSEVMNLNANSRVVVSVPADTKIYIVFTKHEEGSAELHKVASGAP